MSGSARRVSVHRFTGFRFIVVLRGRMRRAGRAVAGGQILVHRGSMRKEKSLGVGGVLAILRVMLAVKR